METSQVVVKAFKCWSWVRKFNMKSSKKSSRLLITNLPRINREAMKSLLMTLTRLTKRCPLHWRISSISMSPPLIEREKWKKEKQQLPLFWPRTLTTNWISKPLSTKIVEGAAPTTPTLSREEATAQTTCHISTTSTPWVAWTHDRAPPAQSSWTWVTRARDDTTLLRSLLSMLPLRGHKSGHWCKTLYS
jgi:hypothetical protein